MLLKIVYYAAPVCTRSSYAATLDQELNKACRAITGCIKPTFVDDLYLLYGIAPPGEIYVLKWKEPNRRNKRHTLCLATSARTRLKSINNFLRSVKPSYYTSKVLPYTGWKMRSRDKLRSGMFGLKEEPAKGYDIP